jgi:hypothetical protein
MWMCLASTFSMPPRDLVSRLRLDCRGESIHEESVRNFAGSHQQIEIFTNKDSDDLIATYTVAVWGEGYSSDNVSHLYTHQIWAGTYHILAIYGKYPKSNVSQTRYALDMQKLYEEKAFSDLIITHGSDKYHLHRAVIEALAPNILETAIHEDHLTVLNLETNFVDKAVLEYFIKYLYCYSMDVPTTIAEKLQDLAAHYHVTHLADAIKAKLSRTTSGLFLRMVFI